MYVFTTFPHNYHPYTCTCYIIAAALEFLVENRCCCQVTQPRIDAINEVLIGFKAVSYTHLVS